MNQWFLKNWHKTNKCKKMNKKILIFFFYCWNMQFIILFVSLKPTLSQKVDNEGKWYYTTAWLLDVMISRLRELDTNGRVWTDWNGPHVKMGWVKYELMVGELKRIGSNMSQIRCRPDLFFFLVSPLQYNCIFDRSWCYHCEFIKHSSCRYQPLLQGIGQKHSN